MTSLSVKNIRSLSSGTTRVVIATDWNRSITVIQIDICVKQINKNVYLRMTFLTILLTYQSHTRVSYVLCAI